jgi:predicted Zn-dependent protease
MLFFGGLRTRKSRLPRSRRACPRLEHLEARLTPYSASTNAWIHPELITLGFVPDGTIVGSNSQGYVTSNLQSTFNAKFGSAAAWQNQILKAAQQWAQQTNLNFAVITDNGAQIGTGSYQQGDPNQADIRFGGYNFGSTTLAQGYMPPPINNYSIAGDIQFNTGQTWNVGSTYDLFTVAMHEIGHALGLYHSGVVSADMYGSYQGTKSALASDDVSGMRSIYSSGAARSQDTYDAAASNGTFATATDLSSTINLTSYVAVVKGLDVSSTSDLDYYKLTLPTGSSGGLSVKVQSTGLSLLAPKLTVYASDQSTVLGTASFSGYTGSTLTVNVASAVAGQTVYLKVQGYDTSAFGTGAYALALDCGPNSLPAVTLPNTRVANGNPISAGGGQAIRLDPEFRVNSTTAGTQQANVDGPKSVAIDSNGDYVVVWATQGQDNAGSWGVFAQRYAADGTPQSSEFRVNTFTAGDQLDPTVAMDAAGDFVIAWSSMNEDGSGFGVYAQRYSAAGGPQGGEFRVNTYTAGDQKFPAVAMDAAGDFVITWTSNGQDGNGNGIYAQRYSAAGAAQGGEFRVNTYTTNQQFGSRAAMDGTGDFVITWTSTGQDGDNNGTYAQRYNSSGVAQGGEFRVNTYTAHEQTAGDVAMDGQGNFVIVWASNGQDGNGYGVYAQQYNVDGTPLGAEFRVNTTTADHQQDPSVTMDGTGNFLVAWSSHNQDGNGWGIYGQQYAAAGAAIGTEFRINTTTAGDQQYPAAVMNGGGLAVVIWSGNGGGDTAGVFGQRFQLVGGSGMSPMEASDAFDPQGHGDGPATDFSARGVWVGEAADLSAPGAARDPVSAAESLPSPAGLGQQTLSELLAGWIGSAPPASYQANSLQQQESGHSRDALGALSSITPAARSTEISTDPDTVSHTVSDACFTDTGWLDFADPFSSEMGMASQTQQC